MPSQIYSTLRFCQKEAGPIADGISLIFRSQLGYEGRVVHKQMCDKCLQTIVAGGNVIDPLQKTQTSETSAAFLPLSGIGDVVERAAVVAAGVETFAELLVKGTYPGSGGYTVGPSNERIYGNSISISKDLASSLFTVASMLSAGLLKVPPIPLPNLQSLGAFTLNLALKQASMPSTLSTGSTVNDVSASFKPKEPVLETVVDTGLTPAEAKFLIDAARSVGEEKSADQLTKTMQSKPEVYRPVLPKGFQVEPEDLSALLAKSKESKVPATRIGRLFSFGQLAVGMIGGAAAEVTRRTVGLGAQVVEGAASNPFLSTANADRIVQTLCRVRGAALKLGQMISIQDSEFVSPALLEIFERVRHSADFMPIRQVHKQLQDAFGEHWRDNFQSFDDKPFAAASIGQVHNAILKDGRRVAVKVQYPGVAQGIDSDMDNMGRLLSFSGLLPKGMFLEAFVKVASKELKEECDYFREARAMREFRKLTVDSTKFYVPEVIDHLSSSSILTTEYIVGKPVDKCTTDPQAVRDYIAAAFIELCLKEIFEWRFMQTDPNWSNFYLGVHPKTGKYCLALLDFGASRSYGKKFVDKYMQIIKAAYDKDDQKILEFSREIGFLTGWENDALEKAHIESVRIMGETLASDHPYDFASQSVTKRIHQLVPVMLENRLTAPPEEIYSLHRKLSGSYLLATKLRATVSCGGLFSEIWSNYSFGEDGKDIIIDVAPQPHN